MFRFTWGGSCSCETTSKNKSSFGESKRAARNTKVSETHEQLPSEVVFFQKKQHPSKPLLRCCFFSEYSGESNMVNFQN